MAIHKDGHGYEIEGLIDAETDQQKIDALEKHLQILKGLHEEIERSVERRISELNHPLKTN